jgi:hypothetical protein
VSEILQHQSVRKLCFFTVTINENKNTQKSFYCKCTTKKCKLRNHTIKLSKIVYSVHKCNISQIHLDSITLSHLSLAWWTNRPYHMTKIIHTLIDYGTTLLYDFTLRYYKTYDVVTKCHVTVSCKRSGLCKLMFAVEPQNALLRKVREM